MKRRRLYLFPAKHLESRYHLSSSVFPAVMAPLCQLFAIGQRADKKVTVKLQRADSSTTQHEQKHSFEFAHSAGFFNLSRFSGLQCGSSFSGQSFDFIESENTGTSHSGAMQGQHYQREYIPKELDARYYTLNNVGRDQRNYFVVNNHFYSRDKPDGADPGICKCVVEGGCQATAIVSAMTFVTKNVALAAPYWGLSVCNAEDLISLTVKTTSVRYSFFSDRYPIPYRNSK